MEDRNQMLEELQFQLNRAQNRMWQAADKKRREVVFDIGDLVYLKIHPYIMKSLATRVNEKLSARFYGPFEVVERIGEVAYRLKLPQSAKIHLVFHVSLLKKSIGPSLSPQPLPTTLTKDNELVVQPEEIKDNRYNKKRELEVLVKWQHLPEFENTWELAEKIQSVFPMFHLEDKVTLQGEGIVTESSSRFGEITPFKYTYKRKRKITK